MQILCSVNISSRNPCTHDSCNATTGGCNNTPFVESDCYFLTGGQKSQCFQYIFNQSNPVCCQALNISESLCKSNYSDKCLDWRCLDQQGCDYFTLDCEAKLGIDTTHFCPFNLSCSNETGCFLTSLDGRSYQSMSQDCQPSSVVVKMLMIQINLFLCQ